MAAYLAGAPVAALRIAAFALIGCDRGSCRVALRSAERGYFNMASPPLLLQAYTAAFLGAAVLAKKKRFDVFGSVFSVFVLLVLEQRPVAAEPAALDRFGDQRRRSACRGAAEPPAGSQGLTEEAR